MKKPFLLMNGGIQALERNVANLPMKPGQPSLQEFEYTRHGTQTLIAGVATGNVYGEVGDTLPCEDFARFIGNMLKNESDDTKWHLISDNLNIHFSESLVQLVANECQITDDLGIEGKRKSVV